MPAHTQARLTRSLKGDAAQAALPKGSVTRIGKEPKDSRLLRKNQTLQQQAHGQDN